MGIVLSMLMIAAGAIMRFAVTVKGNGFNVGTAGMVLMVVGIIGAVLSIAFWASWGGSDGRRTALTSSAPPVPWSESARRGSATERGEALVRAGKNFGHKRGSRRDCEVVSATSGAAARAWLNTS